MKTLTVLALVALAGIPMPIASAVSVNFSSLNIDVPDGSPFGVSNTQMLNTGLLDPVTDVDVLLNISGDWNGDLYVGLAHGSGYSVLLNRVGRRASDVFGYGDGGFNLRFDDQAPNGDVHRYRLTLSGNHNSPISGPLEGVWAPDGRTSDPENVLDVDARSALLSSFNGSQADGEWTLFIADFSYGATSRLVSWGLDVSLCRTNRHCARNTPWRSAMDGCSRHVFRKMGFPKQAERLMTQLQV